MYDVGAADARHMQVTVLRPVLETMDAQQIRWLCRIILKGAAAPCRMLHFHILG